MRFISYINGCCCSKKVGQQQQNQDQEQHIIEHQYVDFGLPSGTKWSSMNIGAESEEQLGLLFKWGEIEPSTTISYNRSDYKWWIYHESEYDEITGDYIDDWYEYEKYGIYSGLLNKLELEDDAAYVLWGENWRIPTYTQVSELINNTDQQKISNYNNLGIDVIVMYEKNKDLNDSNTKRLIFPIKEYSSGSHTNLLGWTNQLSDIPNVADIMADIGISETMQNYLLPIRPVSIN